MWLLLLGFSSILLAVLQHDEIGLVSECCLYELGQSAIPFQTRLEMGATGYLAGRHLQAPQTTQEA